MDNQKPTVIDLFAGVGGFSLGALRAGFDLKLAVELDKNALAAHKLNFPNVKHLPFDIAELDGETLLSQTALGECDLDGLVGGPPCQGFSLIGKRSSSDSRNSLFTKFFELVQACQPKFYVAENVLGILQGKYSEIRDEALKKVTDDYIMLEPLRLKASDFGAPTTRERVFFIGYRKDVKGTISCDNFKAYKVNNIVTVEEALQGLPLDIDRNWIKEAESWRPVGALPDSPFWKLVKDCIPNDVGDAETVRRYQEEQVVSGCFGTRHSEEIMERYGSLKPGERDQTSKSVRLEANGLCPTLRAGTNSERGGFQAVRPIHPTLPRVITPREAARLQGFPDWFRFAPNKWQSFRQIGNSISPIVSEIIFKVIKEQLDLTNKPAYERKNIQSS